MVRVQSLSKVRYMSIIGVAFILAGCQRTLPGQQLREAAAAGDLAQVNRLLAEFPAAVNDADPSTGMTALEWSVITGDQAVVKAILAHGAKVDAYDKLGGNAMYHAIRKDNWPMVQLLLDYGAHINGQRFLSDRATPLIVAAIGGSQSMCQHLLTLGANLNERDSEGMTAADHARDEGYKELALFLEQHASTMPKMSP